MTARFRRDDRGRVSFAVISVIILISASATSAYVYTISQKELNSPNIPVTDYENVHQDILNDLMDIAVNSLQSALSVYKNALTSNVSNVSTTNIMDSYCENASKFFQNNVTAKYPADKTQGHFEVNLVIETSDNRTKLVSPTYTELYVPTEVGNGPQLVPNGFVLNATIELNALDTNTRSRFRDGIVVHANISTDMPMALQLLASVDLSNLDNILSSMVGAVLFARIYGTWSQNMGIDLTNISDPNKTLAKPSIDVEKNFVQGFGSDIGPVPNGTLMSGMDLDIIQDLAFILFQVRDFGIWDNGFVDRFLDKVHGYSFSDEGKRLDRNGLRSIIGDASPNFVNCEAVVLELFHRMGRVPTNVNIVLPLLKKMLNEGFMGLFDNNFETWMKQHLLFPKTDLKNMFKSGGWFDPSWLFKDPFILASYGIVLEQFLSMALGFILRAYHLDRSTEIKEFVNSVFNGKMNDIIIKNIPTTVDIPPGRPIFKINLKMNVQSGIMKGLDTLLNSLIPTNIMGIRFNGYTWVYLFMMAYDRPVSNDTLMQINYDEVYKNWTQKAQSFISGKNISALTVSVNKTFSDFEKIKANETTALNDMYKVDFTSNQTINNSLKKAISILRTLSENYSKASIFVNGTSRFFIYNQGGETSNWNNLNNIRTNLTKILPALYSVEEEMLNYTLSLNGTSPIFDNLTNTWFEISEVDRELYNANDLFINQLKIKWMRDVLSDSKAELDGLIPGDTSSGTLYNVVGLLSENIGIHPNLGFNGTLDQMANDIANISSESKGLTFNRNGTKFSISLKNILKDDRGIKGIIKLLDQNLVDIRTSFVDMVSHCSNIQLIDNRSGWASHKTFELASVRLLNGSYAESMSDLLMEKSILSAEEKKYSNATPLELWQNKSDFKIYGERSYLDLELYVMDALTQKLGDLQQIFEATEVHPGLAATFNGVHRDRPDGPLPISNIILTYDQKSSYTKWKGLRVFENTSSVAPENVLFQYLNPFSKEWFDYYLTNILLEGNGQLNMHLGFNETSESNTGLGPRAMQASIFSFVNYSTVMSTPTPLPVTNIRYSPTASFFKRLTSVELDRNVFSEKWNKAHVNFTFDSAGGKFKNDTFKVQVKAVVRQLSSSFLIGIASSVQGMMSGKETGIERDVTGIVDVADNDKNDLDPRDGHVSVEVTFDLDKLKTKIGGITLHDYQPILQVMVWKPSSFNALMSEVLLESVTGQGQLYSIAPTMQVNEQGFFYFDNTEDPVIGVYDVGESDREVDVPLEIYLEDLTSVPLMTVDLKKFSENDLGAFAFPKDDPRTNSVFKLTCNFTIIRKIPTDSAVVMNKNIPLLVDFDNRHEWLRDLHLNMLMFEKGLGDEEEFLLSAVLPRTTWEKEYVTLLPPSEYKFALSYNFMPVYMQYFNGYLPHSSLDDIGKGKTCVIPLGQADNPDFYHIPYRVVPMNINRGKIAFTLWYELVSELLKNNYTLNIFIYDVVGTVVKELGDLIDEVQFIKGTSDLLDTFNSTFEVLKMVRKVIGYWKTINDFIKLLPLRTRPGLVKFSIPGSKEGLDWGNNYYLGFDIGTGIRKDEANKRAWEMTALMLGLGFWYDIKTIVKMLKEICALMGDFNFNTKGVETDKFSEDMKKIAASPDTYSNMVTKMVNLMNPPGGKSGAQYQPAPLFMVQKKYNITNLQIKQNADLAEHLGVSAVDVSILRHRNGLTFDDMTSIHDDFGMDQYGFHGMACLVDLNNSNKYSVLPDPILIRTRYANLCDYGPDFTTSDWSNISDAIAAGVPMEAVNKSAKIGLPYNLLQKCLDLKIDPMDMVQRAEALQDVPGHETLFKYLKKNPDRIGLIDAAYTLKPIASLFITPYLTFDYQWFIGPDLYFRGRAVYVYTLSSMATTRKDMDAFVTASQFDALGRTNRTYIVFYDLRFSKKMGFTTYEESVIAQSQRNDKKFMMRYQVSLDQNNMPDTFINGPSGYSLYMGIPPDIG